MEMLPMIRFSPNRTPVRIFPQPTDQGIKPLIPLVDVAVGIGLHRTHLFRFIKRNHTVFDGQSELIQRRTVGLHGRPGNQRLLCVTPEGLTGLLAKISHSRPKNPATRDNICAFQRWAIMAFRAIRRRQPAAAIQLQAFCLTCRRAGVEPTKSRMRTFMRAAGITYSISTAYRCTAEVRAARPRPGRGFLAAVQQLLDQPTHVNPHPNPAA